MQTGLWACGADRRAHPCPPAVPTDTHLRRVEHRVHAVASPLHNQLLLLVAEGQVLGLRVVREHVGARTSAPGLL